MKKEERRKYYDAIFEGCDEKVMKLISRTIDGLIDCEIKMDEVKKLPFVEVNPKNPAKQRRTAAATVFKECFAQHTNAIRVLMKILILEKPSDADELLKRLEEFE